MESVKNGLEEFLSPIVKYYPKIMEEIFGMSEGAKINLRDLMLAMFDEETYVLSERPRLPKCTTIGAHLNNGDIVIGHNEDWLAEIREDGLAIVRAEIGDLKFLSLFYVGSLPGTSCSINSYGIGFSGNSIDGKKFRYGIPKSIRMRAILEAKTLKEASDIDTLDPSINNNIMIASKNEGLLDSEDLWKVDRLFKDKKFLVHTNHPIEKKYQNKNNTEKESIERYEYLTKRIGESDFIDEDLIKNCLKVHTPIEICGHISKKISYAASVTVASAFINVTQKFIDITPSTPCNHEYKRYHL